MQGYAHERYAASLSEFGIPAYLPGADGWILKREIRGFPEYDAMGCYPLFTCSNWASLPAAVEAIDDPLVSLSIVTDPFGEFDENTLRRSFPDLVKLFKRHFVTDLTQSLADFVNPHHQRNVLKAQREIQVERSLNPASLLDDWTNLYRTLIAKHDITGIAAFSRSAFEKQFSVPGIVAFRAIHQDSTVGMLLWYEQENRAYYHLGAYNDAGYDQGASFALFDFALRYFADAGTRWLSLGAGAGLSENNESGLGRFKRGWSTGSRPVYFCGKILNPEKYKEIVLAKRLPPTDYFPAYRADEFA